MKRIEDRPSDWESPTPGFGPDAHGQAALLLIESLLHGLIARKVINTHEAIEMVEIAADVKEEIGLRAEEPEATVSHSLALLAAIANSLRTDTDGD